MLKRKTNQHKILVWTH